MKTAVSSLLSRIASKISSKKLKEEVAGFLKENPNPSDDVFHDWAEKHKYDVHAAESAVYNLLSDYLTGNVDLPADALLPYLRRFIEKTADDWNYITPEQLKKKIDSGTADYFILDIRKPDVYRKGHIKGAKNIFWMDLLKPENLKKLPKDRRILLYCYVGHTSSQALVLLKLLGYDVVSLKFGMGISPVEGVPVAGWTDMGYPVTES